MPVDSYRWLPRRLADIYRAWPAVRAETVPWTPLPVPLKQLTLAFVTTAGVYVEGREPPFDTDRERREPTWGDPSFRTIPLATARQGIGASHLHVNNAFVCTDLNVAMPFDPALDAVAEGRLGAVAQNHYSLMGYQLDSSEWERRSVPAVAGRLRAEGVHAALITPF